MKISAWAALAALVASGIAGAAGAETFKMQTFLGPSASTTVAFERMAEELKAATDGEIEIEVLPANAVVGRTETIDAIRNGILQGQYTAPSYFAGKDPAMAVLGDTLSAYPDSATQLGWFSEGGGAEIAQALYDNYDLHVVCWVYWPPEQIPSVRPINTVSDFQGLKIRAPEGLVGDLLTRAGASIVNLGVSEATNAMETGVIDATDLANIGLNVALGFHNVAKYSVLARHSMATTEVSVSKEAWEGLSASAQQAFTEACNDMSDGLQVTLDGEDSSAAEQATGELGVTIIEFGAEDQAAFRDLLQGIWDDWAEKSPEARAIIDSHRAYLAELGLL